jgi:hypothetical protein
MAAIAITRDEVLNTIVVEIAGGVDAAVECWMAQIEEALTDAHLTTLGKVHAIKAVLGRYKDLTGKDHLETRKHETPILVKA